MIVSWPIVLRSLAGLPGRGNEELGLPGGRDEELGLPGGGDEELGLPDGGDEGLVLWLLINFISISGRFAGSLQILQNDAPLSLMLNSKSLCPIFTLVFTLSFFLILYATDYSALNL